jgi:predicted RNase H-like HicB family nuclease
MDITLTVIFEKVDGMYMATVAELPGAISLGKTAKEARENLEEAIELVLEGNRFLAEEANKGKSVTFENIVLKAA